MMVKKSSSALPTFFRDLFRLFPAEYCLLLEPNSISFLRVSGKDVEVLLSRRVEVLSTDNSIQLTIQSLRDSGVYYGQPIVVIVNTARGYSYYKRFGTIGASQFYETVRTLQNDTVDLRTGVLKGKSGRIFASQAVEKDILTKLVTACEQASINVTRLVTLSSASVASVLDRHTDQNSIDINLVTTGSVAYLVEDGSGSVLFGTTPIGQNPQAVTDVVSKLRSGLVESADEVKVTTWVGGVGAPTASREPRPSIGMRHLLKAVGKLKGFDYSTDFSRTAVIVKTCLNSARLLIMVLGTVSLLTLISTAVTSLMSTGENVSIQAYQAYYNSRLSLEKEREDLLSDEQVLLNSRIEGINVAAILSAFCQRSYPSVSLNRIYLVGADRDSTQVEITGSARNEGAIFRYHEAIGEYVRPYSLNLSYVKPDIKNMRGISDTTLIFKLNMVINE